MPLLCSCENDLETRQRAISEEIDKSLLAKPTHIIQRLLLLGAGESGKSTLCKQLKILHLNGFTEKEIEEKKYLIYENITENMRDIVHAMPKLNIKFTNSTLLADVLTIDIFIKEKKEFFIISPHVVTSIKRLWKDKNVQECYAKRSEFQLADNAKYYFDNLERIADTNYKPTLDDILHSRIATTGINNINFMYKKIEFIFFDVGGQRTQRRKWLHLFDDVNAIIFVAAISEYDQNLRENPFKNRLIETLELFGIISNNKYLEKIATLLFMNKKDIFEEKLSRSPLNNLFKDYTGEADYAEGVKYLKRKFNEIYRKAKPLYLHETCATDRKQMEQIFNSVLDNLITENLEQIIN